MIFFLSHVITIQEIVDEQNSIFAICRSSCKFHTLIVLSSEPVTISILSFDIAMHLISDL